VRWSVELPDETFPILPAGGTVEQGWGRLGWLVGPRPAATAVELQQWFAGPGAGPSDGTDPQFVCWQAAPAGLTVWHAPRQVWLLGCSLALLVAGLFFAVTPLPRPLFWFGLAVAGLALLGVALFAPGALPALAYGCQPGLFVLAFVLGGQWLLHRRHRRRAVFLPGFTRVKTGSSLLRPGSGNRPREPSTVDEPPRRGTSASSEL
jgi:hypothetical protein